MEWNDLLLWTCKCLAELWLMAVCFQRNIRFLWIRATISFSTGLALMLIAEFWVSHYNQMANYGDLINKVADCAVLASLASLVIDRQRGFLPILGAFTLLVASDVAGTVWERFWGMSDAWARYQMASWTAGILLLIRACRRIPPKNGENVPISLIAKEL